ncbi:unnamed protein product [Nyctereutes procyonoides]|uniref:(raccoon dog) hypothetical protein n=1 Tax=Nyctereutes procyonoides TaxID=34880 RepID=A0A811YUH2_NYCPR|nr:unnamed protein product [Nyctereutes procyonoides]
MVEDTSSVTCPLPSRGCPIADHFGNSRNVESLDKTSKNVVTGLVGVPARGDVMTWFKTFGSGSVIAFSSLAPEWNRDIKELCLLPLKLHCSMIAKMQSRLPWLVKN